MTERILPALDLPSFVCPYCNNSAQQLWAVFLQEGNGGNGHNNQAKTRFSWSFCELCKEHALWVGHTMVWPRRTSRDPIPTEVTDPLIIEDYNEACLVLIDSPKASAALSRRCLQYILVNHMGAQGKDLSPQIEWAKKHSNLPSYISEHLDYVRWVGNFSAHPIKDQQSGQITSVEPGEAEWNLTVLEDLFDFLFVKPALAKAKKDALNLKLVAANRPQIP